MVAKSKGACANCLVCGHCGTSDWGRGPSKSRVSVATSSQSANIITIDKHCHHRQTLSPSSYIILTINKCPHHQQISSTIILTVIKHDQWSPSLSAASSYLGKNRNLNKYQLNIFEVVFAILQMTIPSVNTFCAGTKMRPSMLPKYIRSTFARLSMK